MTVVTCQRCGYVTTSAIFMLHVCPGPHDSDSHSYEPDPHYVRPATHEEARLWELERDRRWKR